MGRARGAVVGGGGMVERWRGRAGGEAVTRGQKRAVGKGRVGLGFGGDPQSPRAEGVVGGSGLDSGDRGARVGSRRTRGAGR
jgi:hypothetical protein